MSHSSNNNEGGWGQYADAPTTSAKAAAPVDNTGAGGWGGQAESGWGADNSKNSASVASNGGWGAEENSKSAGGWGGEDKPNGGAGGWGHDEGSAAGGWGQGGGEESGHDGRPAGGREGRVGSSGGSRREPEHNPELVNSLLQTLSQVDVKLADKQADVNSPLYSIKTFEELGLDPNLLKGIYAMKFVRPSKVQERALPLLLANPPQNMIAQSQSGTGKTAAFALTMLSRVDTNEAHVQAICVTPTRELARQILEVVRTMGQFTNATAALALPETVPTRDAVIQAHIVIGTPGTIINLERRRVLDLTRVRIFVLDEADVMLDKEGMGVQSMRIRNMCPQEAQLLLFSATFSDSVREFAHRIIPNANEISLRREELSVDAIKQFYMECDGFHHKMDMLAALYGLLTVSQSIIFFATRNSADEVKRRMEAEGHKCSLLHGGLTPEERDKVIDEFRQGGSKVLLSTNVLSRGIDVMQVSLVVNFDMPVTTEKLPDPETYLHRIGRTGRFGRSGIAINMISNRESMAAVKAFEEFFGREIARIPIDDLEVIESKLGELKQQKTVA